MTLSRSSRKTLTSMVIVLAALLGGAGNALLGVCGPFTDFTDAGFCPFVLEIFYLGITTGTTPTTYDPVSSVSRLQMAAFLSRTVDGVLKRGSRRAALNQFWTTEANASLALTTVGAGPAGIVSDGEDVWVASLTGGSVLRVHGSSRKLLETWPAATAAYGVLAAMGRIFATGSLGPNGRLYQIDPILPVGAVTTVATNLGGFPLGISYDGSRIWTANAQSISIVTPGAATPWSVTTVTSGFGDTNGMLYDGANIWVTSSTSGVLPGAVLKLDSSGAILQTVTVGIIPTFPIFDGSNIWVPNLTSSSVSVVRASSGAVLATLTGNGLFGPSAAAFDGQRILVTNSSGNSVSLWKAASFAPLGSFSTGAGSGPSWACSDGINFWITLQTTGRLARF